MRRILITGGSGSLGRAIVERAEADRSDDHFTIYSRDESRQASMWVRFPDARYVLGDVRDVDTLEAAARGADLIIHAAAHKRVPEGERQPIACAQSNVDGTIAVIHVARRLGTPRVVGISTDKACAPINAYGFTKALMERMYQAEATERPDGPIFTLVRYGNVLASTGSVVPAFEEQARAGGPLRVTDPGMTRFWLTLDEAVSLVFRAADAPQGTTVIPMCSASTMAALAEAVAPGVPVVTTGTRGGEKRHEQLLTRYESPFANRADGIFLLRPLTGKPVGELPNGFEYRSDTAPRLDPGPLRDLLRAA